jgi:hypothetical protein
MKWTFLQKISYFLIAILILCVPAFYNGFPFLFPDTVGYVSTGFSNEIGAARVWLYGGFLRHISLYETLWLVVFAQGAIVAGVIYLTFKYFLKSKYTYNFFIIYLFIVGSTTAISFHVSMLMPDIFTSVIILSFILLLFAKNLSLRDQMIAILLFVGGIGMHNTHIVLALGLILCVLMIYSIKKWRLLCNSLGINLKKIGLIGSLIFVGYISTCTLHYSLGGDFSTTRGSRIFLFARLCDFGIAQSYLEENCASTEGAQAICEDINMLGKSNAFLWGDQSKSYLNKTGGFSKENEIYYQKLTTDILTTPKYFKKYIIKSTEAMFMQFFTYETRVPEESYGLGVYWVDQYFGTYSLAVRNSRQWLKRYSKTSMERENATQSFVFGIAALFFLFLLWDTKCSKGQKGVALFILTALFVNAFIAGAASGVYGRYQSRVAWLITLPAFWFVCTKIEAFMTSKVTTEDKSKINQ